MAVLESFPSAVIIQNLHGILDFYYCRGIPCVRTWPCKPRNTPAMRKTHTNLKRGLALWSDVKGDDYTAYSFAVSQSEWTNRDLFLSNVLIMKTPRSVIALDSIHLIGNYIYVNIDLIAGDKPLLSVNWCDSMESKEYVNWTKSYKEISGYRFGTKNQPHFKTGYMKTISWLNSHGFFIFRNRFRVLFFHFVDPHGLTNFSSGVYHYDFRP